MQHDSVTQLERKVDSLARLGRNTMRQEAGVHKAISGRRRRGANIAPGMGQLRPPARVARMGDVFLLAEGGGRKSARHPPLKNSPVTLRHCAVEVSRIVVENEGIVRQRRGGEKSASGLAPTLWDTSAKQATDAIRA